MHYPHNVSHEDPLFLITPHEMLAQKGTNSPNFSSSYECRTNKCQIEPVNHPRLHTRLTHSNGNNQPYNELNLKYSFVLIWKSIELCTIKPAGPNVFQGEKSQTDRWGMRVGLSWAPPFFMRQPFHFLPRCHYHLLDICM